MIAERALTAALLVCGIVPAACAQEAADCSATDIQMAETLINTCLRIGDEGPECKAGFSIEIIETCPSVFCKSYGRNLAAFQKLAPDGARVAALCEPYLRSNTSRRSGQWQRH
jgi:hypothetical protein